MSELATLLAERDIRAAMARYCRGIDRLDEDLIRSAFHRDSYDNHGLYQGGGYEFAAWVVPMLRQVYVSTTHLLGNSHIELAGATAAVETYFIAYHVVAQPRQMHVLSGRYADRFECRDGEWKVAHRTVLLDWDEIRPVDQQFPEQVRATFALGRRDRDDLSYQL
ncbi:nuclear transport factor 2 family protein [Pseudonocardia spinosispora]|uniref:nuclear transport factor 2 family protein n=1 Tax=Pseudonocardia spinosispora TaxID=103441 RepID=UPI00056706CE|nr:nuclear transport factor 2 family protein [Pseudonocardia spinosispora]